VSTKIANGKVIQVEYAKWLDTMKWTYWTTLTTRYKLTMKSARRMMEGMQKELQKGGEAQIFFAIEPFDIKEGYHIHALILAPKVYKYKHIIQLFQHVSGNKVNRKNNDGESTWNRCEVEKYYKSKGANYYCAKYITKELSDYNLLTSKEVEQRY